MTKPPPLADAIAAEMSVGDRCYHDAQRCAGHPCPFHAPSDHKMATWPRNLRASGLTERICAHGIGHPDPDSLAWMERIGLHGYEMHGCDGCCGG